MASGSEFAQLHKSEKSAASGSETLNVRNVPCLIDLE